MSGRSHRDSLDDGPRTRSASEEIFPGATIEQLKAHMYLFKLPVTDQESAVVSTNRGPRATRVDSRRTAAMSNQISGTAKGGQGGRTPHAPRNHKAKSARGTAGICLNFTTRLAQTPELDIDPESDLGEDVDIFEADIFGSSSQESVPAHGRSIIAWRGPRTVETIPQPPAEPAPADGENDSEDQNGAVAPAPVPPDESEPAEEPQSLQGRRHRDSLEGFDLTPSPPPNMRSVLVVEFGEYNQFMEFHGNGTARGAGSSNRTRQVNIRHLWTRELINNGTVLATYAPTTSMTNLRHGEQFRHLRALLLGAGKGVLGF